MKQNARRARPGPPVAGNRQPLRHWGVRPRRRDAIRARPAVASPDPVPPPVRGPVPPPIRALELYDACTASRGRESARGLERMASWGYNVVVSVPRILAMMGDDERDQTPAEAVARWFGANCRGAWEVFPVPGVGLVACMDDARCARRFAPAFGVDNVRGRLEMEDER